MSASAAYHHIIWNPNDLTSINPRPTGKRKVSRTVLGRGIELSAPKRIKENINTTACARRIASETMLREFVVASCTHAGFNEGGK